MRGEGGIDMTDVLLLGIFVLCIVTGYIAVRKSGGFLELILFHNPKVWYNHEKNPTDADSVSDEKSAVSERQGISRLDKVQGKYHLGRKKNYRAKDDGTKGYRAKDYRTNDYSANDYRVKNYRPKDYKAGIKHEWKTN